MIVGTAAILGLLVYEFVPREETRIIARLSELCSALNQTRDQASLARLRRLLAVVLEPQVEVHLADLDQDLEGLDQVAERARMLLEGPPLTFALTGIQVQQSGRLARVEADLLVTVRGSGEQRRDARHTLIRLAKSDSGWQIEAVDVAQVAASEPEARP